MSQQTSLLGSSAATRALDGDITAAARSDAKVLITGESGVGKEVAARLVHERSQRARLPLVTINCAGLPESLLETELFGHVKGSFTGAYRDKPGLLQVAHGGTIFLDEVGEMTLRMQALLLRFLETGEIQRVGAERLTDRVDVRVICATHRDLRARIGDGTFREDLFYRMNVIHVHIQPLRERRDDIRDLFLHFLESYSQSHRMTMPALDQGVLELVLRYLWPGNVRELRNVAERLIVRNQPLVTIADLPSEVRLAARTPVAVTTAMARDEQSAAAVVQQLLRRILVDGQSFWEAVYEPFESHDLTREHLRLLVGLGLEQTQGRYSTLTELFNMKKGDYKRFLNALRKHDCLVPYHAFRNSRPGAEALDPDIDPADADPDAAAGAVRRN
jgi:two-component system, NtrC family, response regulator AtoC